jgi:putative FmdB family regulatory protein
MPTYEYECQACGHTFEELQGMTDAKLTKCPKCHKNKLSRLIGGGSGMIFKGSGFYETDYKKKSVPSAEKKDTSKPSSSPSAKPSGSCGGGCACHPH